MSAPRVVVLIISLGFIATAVVSLRWEQARLSAGLLRSENRWVQLRREWWSLQTQSSLLRTPERLRDRIRFTDQHPRMLADSSPATIGHDGDGHDRRFHIE